jgi:hypothetical protein
VGASSMLQANISVDPPATEYTASHSSLHLCRAALVYATLSLTMALISWVAPAKTSEQADCWQPAPHPADQQRFTVAHHMASVSPQRSAGVTDGVTDADLFECLARRLEACCWSHGACSLKMPGSHLIRMIFQHIAQAKHP